MSGEPPDPASQTPTPPQDNEPPAPPQWPQPCDQSQATGIGFAPLPPATSSRWPAPQDQHAATAFTSSAPSDLPASPPLPPGEVLGERYRIVQLIASGGMGSVYEAEDLTLERTVALKVLHEALLQIPRAVDLFRQEVLIASQLTHPNICRVFDFSRINRDDRPPLVFLTMELLRGQTLAEHLARETKLRPETALPILEAIAAGLDVAHGKEVIHGDLKPGNVMLARRPVLLDFGLASLIASNPGFRLQPGEIIGTPIYMAPEQVLGKPPAIEIDIYSLGVIAYEMVTGLVPFLGKTRFETANLRLNSPPRPPVELAPFLPPAWNLAILRALALDPKDRFPSAGEFVRALAAPSPGEFSRMFGPNKEPASVPPAPPAAGAFTGMFQTSAPAATPMPQSPGGPNEYARMMPRTPSPTVFPPQAPGRVSEAPTGIGSAPAAAAPPSNAETAERTLDLAIGSVLPVGIPAELIAFLRLPQSASLASLLAQDRDTSLAAGDVRSRNLALDFLRDATGRLQPVDVTMRVIAPDFDPPRAEKLVRVRPDSDSERQVFLLTPSRTGDLRIQFDLLLGDLTLASRSLLAHAQTGQSAAAPPVVISVPIVVRVQPRRRAVLAAAGAVLLVGAGALVALLRSPHTPSTADESRGVIPAQPSGANAALDSSSLAQAKNYALIIAQDQYDYWPALRNPVKDGRDIGRELQTTYGFDVRYLNNAKLEDVLEAIKSYRAMRFSQFDQLLVYIAGHGTYDEQEQRGFLIFRDSKLDAQDPVHLTQLPHETLRAVLDSLPALHVFLVIDACFGGAIDPKISQSTHRGGDDSGISLDQLRLRRAPYKTRQFLTSGSKEFVSDGRGENSPFARVFLEALRSDGGSQRYLSIARLRPYFERTQSEARQGSFGGDDAGSEFFFVPLK